jgi:hypothetical protein
MLFGLPLSQTNARLKDWALGLGFGCGPEFLSVHPQIIYLLRCELETLLMSGQTERIFQVRCRAHCVVPAMM